MTIYNQKKAARMNSSATHDDNCGDNLHARENEAWRLVVERETGKKLYSEIEIQRKTNAAPRRIRQMVGRCRAMRRALGWRAKLPTDWQEAILMTLPIDSQ